VGKRRGAVETPQVWKGIQALAPFLVPIASLTPAARNARTHPERNLVAIAASLSGFGQTKPIVHREGVVIAGNGTLAAAIRLGWTQLAAVALENVTEVEAAAYGLADNKTGVLAEWDFQTVAELFRELPEDLFPFTGFADFEISPLLMADWTPPAVKEPVATAVDVVTITVNREQWTVIERAISDARATAAEPTMTAGRALVVICSAFTNVPE